MVALSSPLRPPVLRKSYFQVHKSKESVKELNSKHVSKFMSVIVSVRRREMGCFVNVCVIVIVKLHANVFRLAELLVSYKR